MTMNLFQMNGLENKGLEKTKGFVKLGRQQSIHPNGRKQAKFYGTEEYQKELRERSILKSKKFNALKGTRKAA